MQKNISSIQIGDLTIEKIEKLEYHNSLCRIEYRVWRKTINEDPFTGRKEQGKAFEGLFLHPKNMFIKLAELAI